LRAGFFAAFTAVVFAAFFAAFTVFAFFFNAIVSGPPDAIFVVAKTYAQTAAEDNGLGRMGDDDLTKMPCAQFTLH
jgi:hypothetical protein